LETEENSEAEEPLETEENLEAEEPSEAEKNSEEKEKVERFSLAILYHRLTIA